MFCQSIINSKDQNKDMAFIINTINVKKKNAFHGTQQRYPRHKNSNPPEPQMMGVSDGLHEPTSKKVCQNAFRNTNLSRLA